jgi:hypothetical protein
MNNFSKNSKKNSCNQPILVVAVMGILEVNIGYPLSLDLKLTDVTQMEPSTQQNIVLEGSKRYNAAQLKLQKLNDAFSVDSANTNDIVAMRKIQMSPPRFSVDAPKSIKQTLVDWGNQSGWKTIWKGGNDFVIQSNLTITAEYFEDAVQQLLTVLNSSDVHLRGVFYMANKTLVVFE